MWEASHLESKDWGVSPGFNSAELCDLEKINSFYCSPVSSFVIWELSLPFLSFYYSNHVFVHFQFEDCSRLWIWKPNKKWGCLCFSTFWGLDQIDPHPADWPLLPYIPTPALSRCSLFLPCVGLLQGHFLWSPVMPFSFCHLVFTTF